MANVLSKVLSNALSLDPNLTLNQVTELQESIAKIASVTVDYGKDNTTNE